MMAKGARSRFYLNHTQRNACLLNLTELSLHIDYTLTSEFEYAVEIIKWSLKKIEFEVSNFYIIVNKKSLYNSKSKSTWSVYTLCSEKELFKFLVKNNKLK